VCVCVCVCVCVRVCTQDWCYGAVRWWWRRRISASQTTTATTTPVPLWNEFEDEVARVSGCTTDASSDSACAAHDIGQRSTAEAVVSTVRSTISPEGYLIFQPTGGIIVPSYGSMGDNKFTVGAYVRLFVCAVTDFSAAEKIAA